MTGFTPGEPGFTSRLQEARYGVSCRDFADLREVMPWDLMLLNDERLASCTVRRPSAPLAFLVRRAERLANSAS